MKYLVIDFFGIKLKAFPNPNKTGEKQPDFLIQIPVWVNESQSQKVKVVEQNVL